MADGEEYADKKVPLVNAELSSYAVAIVPLRDRTLPPVNREGKFEQGSGTCIRIADRFFIATAAHVIDEFPKTRYMILSPTRTDQVRRIVGGDRRGGGDYDSLDVGWLELSSGAAASLRRSFLPVERIHARCDGAGENLAFYGAAEQDQQTSTAADGLPVITANGYFWATRALVDRADLGYEPDMENRLYLDWPKEIVGHDGGPYPLPDAPGMSGGGIWALNLNRLAGDAWRPQHAQLIGIETGWIRRDVPRRHLRGYQMHTWLQMVRDDIPELASVIDPYLSVVAFPTRRDPRSTPSA